LYSQQSRVYDKWRLGNRTVQVRGPLFSDDADVVRRWALEGEGIVYKSWLDVSADIAAGALEILLPEHPGEPTPVTLVCPHRKQITRGGAAAWLAARTLRHAAPGGVLQPVGPGV
jgi:DNA-binding transcriptional LysR family regulator